MGEEKSVSEKNEEYQDYEEKMIIKYGIGIRHLQIACMCLVCTTLYLVRCSMGVAVLAMTDRSRLNNTNITIFDWDKKTQGVILSSFFWGYMAMQIPAGLLAKRFGGKPIILVALIANGILCVLLPILAEVGGWGSVCAARVVTGLTQACLFPASHTLLGRWLPDSERTFGSAIVYAGVQIGNIIGLPLSGLLASTTIGWKLIFYAMGALLLVTAAFWQGLAASTPAEHPFMTNTEREFIEADLNTSTKGMLATPWREILTSLPMLAIIVAHCGMTAGFVLFLVDMPSYLERGLQISLKNSASLSALPYVGMWIGGLLSSLICETIINRGYLSLEWSRKLFNSIGMYGVTVGLILLCFTGPDNKAYAVIILVFALSLFGSISAGVTMNHLDLSPNFGGIMFAVSNFIGNVFAISIPIINGFILGNDPTDVTRWHKVFLIAAVICGFTNTIYVWLGKTDKQPWDHPDWKRVPLSDPEEMKPVTNQMDEKKGKNITNSTDGEADSFGKNEKKIIDGY